MSLAEALDRAAQALPAHAECIWPANGDPDVLLEGLDPEAARELVAWLLAEEPDDAEELASRWAELPAGPEILVGIDEATLPKPGRKVLRRLRHRMRSSGLEIAREAPAAPVIARLGDVGDRLDLAFVSALDPRGGRLAYLVESRPGGGARMIEMVLDDTRGLVEFEVYAAGRSKVRHFLRSLQQRQRLAVHEVEPASLRALLARVLETGESDRPPPAAFLELRSRLLQGLDGVPTPGEQAREALGDPEPEPEALRRVADRVRQGDLGPWPPARPVLEGLAERFKEGASSGLVLTPAQRRQRLEGHIDVAVEEVFDDAFTGITASRLRESAYGMWKQGREEDARACLAAARAFEEGPPVEHPVARAMLEGALAPVLGELLGAAEPESGSGESGEAGDDETSPGSLLVEP